MTYMPLRTVTIDLGNLRGQIFSRTEFAPSAVWGGAPGRRARAPARALCEHALFTLSLHIYI